MRRHYGPRFRVLHDCTDQAITGALAQMELTAAQGRILAFLSRCDQPPCPKDIEEEFGLTHPTVSGLLSRLERKQFIALCPDPDDKRCKRVILLEKGEACNQSMRTTIDGIEARMVQGFTPEEEQQFTALLDRAIANMGGKLRRKSCKEETMQ